MKIIKGSFIYKGEASRGLYIPSGGTLVDAWANPVSSHVTGEKYKPFPDRLTITFFSNAKKQFYKGEFKLPYTKILDLFQQGVVMNKEHPVYSRIRVGVAPGGAVAVWVIGSGDRIEFFFGQAEKIELDPGSAFALPFDSKEEADAYIAKQLVNVPEPDELESLKKNGIPIGLWERYRDHYEWEAILRGRVTLNDVGFEYLNGERNNTQGMLLRPVPKILRFTTEVNKKGLIYIVKFDEFEIMDAFEKLGANNQKIYLEFEPRLPREQLKARLYNEKESIVLKKFVSKK